MSNEEALKIATSSNPLMRGSITWLCEGYVNCIITALEHQQKYRWHDLRKEPSDLPSDYNCDWVYAQIEEDNGYRWIPQRMEYRKAIDDWYEESLGWLKNHKGAFKVIGWQMIEPFFEETDSITKDRLFTLEVEVLE